MAILEFHAAGRDRLAALRDLAARKPLGAAGALVVILFVAVALAAPLLMTHDPYLIDGARVLRPPGPENWLGTDELGRDLWSRLILGSRVSLIVGVFSVLIGTGIGAVLGLVGGYFGGRLDYLIQRVVDTMMSFPMLILALMMVAALGPALENVIIAIAVVIMPGAARVIRAATLQIRERQFVEAAVNLGYSDARIIFFQILPNCVAPYIILATAGLAGAILSEAALSFLGLGIPPPEPSWGGMLSGKTQSYMTQAPWLAIFPGLAISIVVFGFNFLGDALRDLLDPRMRGG
ncbi:MAG: ABC transporter permease [Rhodovulum sulfidophilum]|uniref:ABC transporter permease n=1 Tax=Rhodovulum sulfidophilum TaxID=35806 RepID=A0A2W5MY21_RHOSU|nr:MAG: ABC transporter permease [Rhodovulum sulfidophilum]